MLDNYNFWWEMPAVYNMYNIVNSEWILKPYLVYEKYFFELVQTDEPFICDLRFCLLE